MLPASTSLKVATAASAAAALLFLSRRHRLSLSLLALPGTVTAFPRSFSSSPAGSELARLRAGIGDEIIHMNAAGASPSPAACHDAVIAHLERERSIGAYAAAAEAEASPEADAHAAIARLLRCDSDEIALAESAQRAWALAFSSISLGARDRILAFEDEYAGNAVAFLQSAKRTGCTLEVLPMRADGIVDIDALRIALESPPHAGGRTVVALTHIASGGSIIQPAERVGALAKSHGALYILDACQSVGAMPVDARALKADFLCGTGRKWLRGPRGTGFLYARKAALTGSEPLVGEPSTIDHTSVTWTSRETYALAPDARRYEMWESAHAARIGLAAAAAFCDDVGPAFIQQRSAELAQRLRSGLSQLPGVVLRDVPPSFDEVTAAELGAARCAHVAFEAESTLGLSATQLHAVLLAGKIGASVSPATHTFDDGLWKRPRVVRISPTYFNTEEEIDAVLAAVRASLAVARKQ